MENGVVEEGETISFQKSESLHELSAYKGEIFFILHFSICSYNKAKGFVTRNKCKNHPFFILGKVKNFPCSFSGRLLL